MIGEYIKVRLLPQIIKSVCEELDIQYSALSDEWLLRLEKNGEAHWIVGYNFDLNNASSIRIAEDKVATYLVLNSARVPAVEHVLAKSLADLAPLAGVLEKLEPKQPYVVKPLVGSGGRNITLHTNLEMATAYMKQSSMQEIALSPWCDIVSEKRVILLDSKLLLAFEKTATHTVDGLRMFNLSQGATPTDYHPSATELDLAKRGATACSLRLAAVDIVTLANGEQKILEINSGFMLENYARHSTANAATARAVYKKIVSATFGS